MTPESPWRQPIVWLVVLLVAAAVAGGVVMVRVAGSGGPMDAVPDAVQRTGPAQQADLCPDARAARRQLSAIVRIDAKSGAVEVLPVTGDFERAQPLQLQLHHPLQAAGDLSLLLSPTELGWRAKTTFDRGHDWNLQLGPADGAWRLRGRLPRGQLAARVHPAIGDTDTGPETGAPAS